MDYGERVTASAVFLNPDELVLLTGFHRKGRQVDQSRRMGIAFYINGCGRPVVARAAPNPCAGLKGFAERGRDAYIEDVTYEAVWDAADWPTRDAMDLAYLSGQRPADVLKMRLPDIRDGFLWLTQGKTRTKLRIAIAGELAALIDRIQGRGYKVTSLALIRNETGQPLSYHALWNRFEEARKRASSSLDAASNVEAAAAVRGFQFSRSKGQGGHGQGRLDGSAGSAATARAPERQNDRSLSAFSSGR